MEQTSAYDSPAAVFLGYIQQRGGRITHAEGETWEIISGLTPMQTYGLVVGGYVELKYDGICLLDRGREFLRRLAEDR